MTVWLLWEREDYEAGPFLLEVYDNEEAAITHRDALAVSVPPYAYDHERKEFHVDRETEHYYIERQEPRTQPPLVDGILARHDIPSALGVDWREFQDWRMVKDLPDPDVILSTKSPWHRERWRRETVLRWAPEARRAKLRAELGDVAGGAAADELDSR